MAGELLETIKDLPNGPAGQVMSRVLSPGKGYINDSVDAVKGANQQGGLPAAAGVALRRTVGYPVAAAVDLGNLLAVEPARALQQAQQPVSRGLWDAGRALFTGDAAPSPDAPAPAGGTPVTGQTGSPARGDGDSLPPQAGVGGGQAVGTGAGTGIPSSTPPAQPQNDVDDYMSSVPESRYDKDIKFTHTLSRMLGMAGLGDKAMNARELNMKLQAARMDDVGAEAQRAFVAGDVTKGIDMFNHMLPNGQKIVGYKKNPDGTFTFKNEKGEIKVQKAEEISETLTTMRNPELLGHMMKKRAEAMATFGKDAALARIKHAYSVDEMLMNKQLTHASAVAIKQLEAQMGKATLTADPMAPGEFTASFPGGIIQRYKTTQVQGKDGKKYPDLVPVGQPQRNPVAGAAPAQAGTTLDTAQIPITINPAYTLNK